MPATLVAARTVLRHSPWDALLIGLSAIHAALLLSVPSVPLIAIGLWWNTNTIGHNFIHRPFFRARVLNRGYSACLSLLLGVPQAIWRERHLRHHRGDDRPIRWTTDVAADTLVVAALWTAIAVMAPRFFLLVYLPGILLGLALCTAQGHFEHAGGTTSHYGWLYNLLFFNDGYHAEHHSHPGLHWTRLPAERAVSARTSGWPPVLRWLDACTLESLERLVLRSPALQRFVLSAHERAFRKVLAGLPPVRTVTVIGGGLFPRTALVLKRLLPDVSMTIVDANSEHLAIARAMMNGRVAFRHERYHPGEREDADLVVIPLSLSGDRARVYREPPAAVTLVHDWIWRSRAPGAPVSWLLLKRLNVVLR